MNAICKGTGHTGATIKRIFPYMLAAPCLFITAALLYRPERYTAACAEGIALWAQCVLPSLFPFMIVCSVLVATGAADGLSRPLERACGAIKLPPCAAICLILGATSGYPAGARTIAELYGQGATDTCGAKKLACICTACGPVFTIATVGAGMFGSAALGAKIFAAHLAAVVLSGVALSLAGKRCRPARRTIKQNTGGNMLESCFWGAVKSSLSAGAFIAFFYTLAHIAADFYILYPAERLFALIFDEGTAKALACGLIEMTGGCAKLSAAESPLAPALAGFTLTFGGACVLCQQLSYLSRAGIRPCSFITIKFFQGALCFVLLLFMT